MKVIKKGNEKTYEVTCNVCNSDLEYTDNDTFYTEVEKQGLTRRTVSHLFREDEDFDDDLDSIDDDDFNEELESEFENELLKGDEA